VLVIGFVYAIFFGYLIFEVAEKVSMKKDNQITGNVGLCYVCYCLSIMGSNAILTVMPTASTTMGKGKIRIRRDFNPFVKCVGATTIEVL